MVRKVYRVGTGVRVDCDCCLTICDQSFLAVTDERPYINPDYPTSDPVNNTDLAFDGDDSTANTNYAYYTHWRSFTAELFILALNSLNLLKKSLS